MNSKFHRHLGLMASIALTAPCMMVQAQESSVRLYGAVSVGVTYKTDQTGGGHLIDVSNSLLSSGYFGLRGTEDLGDGLGALYRLESGISADSGTAGGSGGKFWNRRSYVGLDWKNAAVLTVGRQFSAAVDRVVDSLDVYAAAGPSLDTQPLGVFGVNRFNNNDTRVDNSVKLRLNGPAGTTLGLSGGLGEGVTARSYSFDLAQLTPDYAIGVYGVKYQAADLIAATGARPEHALFGVGGQLPFGPAALYLNALRSTLDSTKAGRAQQKNSIVSFGLRYTVSTVILKTGYTHDSGTDLNGVVGRNGKKQTLVVSGEYLFSKRTSVYAAAYTNRFSDGYKLESLNIAAMNRDPAASSLSGYSVGLRHAF